MKPIKIIAGAGIILAGLAVAAIAQQPGMGHGMGNGMGQGMGRGMNHDRMGRGMRADMTDADRAAFMDSRFAGMKTALKLTAEQEKAWPSFESAMRDIAKDRMAMRETMMQQRDAMRAANSQPDAITMMRTMSGMAAQRATMMTRVADAAEPLYKTLDDTQKRRFGMMLRRAGGGGMGHGGEQGGHRGGRH